MRTQLILEGWQYDSLKSLAEKRETSLSSIVREAVSEYLDSTENAAALRLEDLRGLGRDKAASGADHDRHLYVRASPRSPRRHRPATRKK
jgi:predicted DNA-binding ribbon-helix-helix protein